MGFARRRRNQVLVEEALNPGDAEAPIVATKRKVVKPSLLFFQLSGVFVFVLLLAIYTLRQK